MLKKSMAVVLAMTIGAGAVQAQDMTVAVMNANVPYEFEDGSGNLVGFEVDVMNALAKRVGKNIEYTGMPFNSLFAAVQSGRADVAIGSIAVTPRRLESVSFTQPIFDANQCLTVTAEGGVKSMADMKDKVLAVVTGSTGEIWATNNQEKYGYTEIRRYDAPNDPLLDVLSDRINGFLNDGPNVAYYIKDKPQYAIAEDVPTNEALALMLAKDSPLIAELDAAITDMKNEGEIARIYEQWMGSPADPESSSVKIKPIPSL